MTSLIVRDTYPEREVGQRNLVRKEADGRSTIIRMTNIINNRIILAGWNDDGEVALTRDDVRIIAEATRKIQVQLDW